MRFGKMLDLRKSKFAQQSLLYTLGSMMTPMISLILLPIYTNYLTPSEYATMTTVQTIVGLLQILLILSLHGAVTRFYFDFLEDRDKRREYIGSIILFVIVFSSLLAFVFLLFSQQLGELIFNNIPANPYFYYLIGLSWTSALLSLPMALFRAQERAGAFVLLNITKAFLVMGLTSYLIIGRGLGAESALISQLLLTFIFMIISFLMQKNEFKLAFNLKFIKLSLLFSIPLLPHVASGWIINSSDRIILENFIPLEDLGYYALAAQVSMVLALFYTSVNNALVPRYTKLRKEGNEKSAERLLKYFLIIVIGFGVMSVPIAVLGVYLIASERFIGALTLIPLLLLGQVVKGIYFIPVAKLFYAKKTKAIAVSSTTAAIVNILINILLIPFIGVLGAVLSTIFAEIVRLSLIFKASNKVIN